MAQCYECKIDYPRELVSRLYSSKGDANLCGICALEFTNQIHGQHRERFDGEQAEFMRQAAIEFRKNLGTAKL